MTAKQLVIVVAVVALLAGGFDAPFERIGSGDEGEWSPVD